MSGGSSHDRRQFKRMLSRLGEIPLPPVADPMKEASKKSVPRAIIELVVGIAFGMAAVFEMYPLEINGILCALGLIGISLGVREFTKESKPVIIKASWRVGAFLLYGMLIFFPLRRQYLREINLHLEFKDSPYFCWWRRQLITHDVAKCRDFLGELGIETPGRLPPFSIQSGAGGGGIATPPKLPIDRSTLTIGESDIRERAVATSTYINYVVELLVSKSLSDSDSVQDIANLGMVREGFASYFNSSFWSTASLINGFPPSNFLWEIRKATDSQFSDKIAAATLKTMVDDPAVRDRDLNIYILRAFMIGDSVVDNECGRWPQLKKVLTSNGISQDQIRKQDFKQSGVSTACIQAWKM